MSTSVRFKLFTKFIIEKTVEGEDRGRIVGRTGGILGGQLSEETEEEEGEKMALFSLNDLKALWAFEEGEPIGDRDTGGELAALFCGFPFPTGRRIGTSNDIQALSGASDKLDNKDAVAELRATRFPVVRGKVATDVGSCEAETEALPVGDVRIWNSEADELSKGIPHSFDERNEVKVEQILHNLKIFNRMMNHGKHLYDEKEEKKAEGR